MLWRVEFKDGSPLGGPPLANGGRLCLLILLEFQSAVDLDPDMAWRMHEYVYLHATRGSNGTLKAEGREPPVLAGGGVQRGPSVDGGGRAGGAGVEGPSRSGWTGNRTRTYVMLDERALAEEGGGPAEAGSGFMEAGCRRTTG